MKQTIFLGIFIFLFINPLSSEAAISTNWDNKTAFMLATTSHCAYMVNGGSNFVNKQRVLNCLLDAAKKNGDTLKEFIDLTEKDIETFVDSKVKDDNINAAILVKIPQGLIVAFRGTEPVINDWLNNLDLVNFFGLFTKLEGYENGRHTGFQRSLRDLHELIKKDTNIWQQFKQSNETLYITGHSKGGALATGASIDFKSETNFNNNKEVVTYTFAAPRFFTQRGRELEENKKAFKNLWRFEYQCDAVPHVPLGKVTYDVIYALLNSQLEKIVPESTSHYIKDIHMNNNINFVPVGRLMFVNYKGKLMEQPDGEENPSYTERFLLIKNKLISVIFSDLKNRIVDTLTSRNASEKYFFIDQHNYYLPFLEALANGREEAIISLASCENS